MFTIFNQVKSQPIGQPISAAFIEAQPISREKNDLKNEHTKKVCDCEYLWRFTVYFRPFQWFSTAIPVHIKIIDLWKIICLFFVVNIYSDRKEYRKSIDKIGK